MTHYDTSTCDAKIYDDGELSLSGVLAAASVGLVPVAAGAAIQAELIPTWLGLVGLGLYPLAAIVMTMNRAQQDPDLLLQDERQSRMFAGARSAAATMDRRRARDGEPAHS